MVIRPRSCLLLTISMALMGGCDRNTEPFVPGEEPQQPDLSQIFPENGSGPQLPEAPVPETTRGAAAATGPGIRGRVELAPEMAGQAADDAVLFVIARRMGAVGGPPVAAMRVVAPRFPHDFEIGPEHVMVPGVIFEGDLQLSARLDSDGNVMTRIPGDLKGVLERALTPGAEGAVIVLDEQL